MQSISEAGSGTLTVTIVEALGGAVARGAQRVPMLTAAFTASCDADISIDSIVLQRKGLGTRTDIVAVYAMQGTKRMSDARTFASRDENVRLRFTDFSIPACNGAEVSFFADFSADASPAGEHRFEVQGAKDIESSAHIVQLRQNAKPQVRRTVGKSVGMISFEILPLLQTVRYGSSQVIARFRMTATSGDDHDLAAITLTNQGSARNGNVQNIFVQSGRYTLSSIVSQLEGDHVRLVFDPPVRLKRNDTRVFELRADVRAGRSKTLRFILEAPGDIEATPAARTR